MSMDRQHLYGLVVEAPFDLHQERPVAPGRATDVRVATGAPTTQRDEPDGRVVLHHALAGDPWYTAWDRGPQGYLLRFHDACDFVVSRDTATVTLHPAEGSDPGLSRVLTTGGMLAFVLHLRRELVLHASAVETADGAVAFVGYSGMGKSTMAALLCAEGAQLVTDDVLRLDARDGGFVARLGATELRLRKGADSLVDRFDGRAPGRRVSADARHVLQVGDGARDRAPLRAVVVPQPDREPGARLAVRRLEGRVALLEMLRYPRFHGWQDPALQADQLAHAAAVARGVPVLVADVPWGPPFAPDLGAQLGRLLDEALSDATPGVGGRALVSEAGR